MRMMMRMRMEMVEGSVCPSQWTYSIYVYMYVYPITGLYSCKGTCKGTCKVLISAERLCQLWGGRHKG